LEPEDAMTPKLSWLNWLILGLFILSGLLGLRSGKRSVLKRMRRGEISLGACFLIAFALIGGLVLGVVVGEKVTRARYAPTHALDVAELQTANAALTEEVAAYRATMDALGIGARVSGTPTPERARILRGYGADRTPEGKD
jgi:hypothetical protein